MGEFVAAPQGAFKADAGQRLRCPADLVDSGERDVQTRARPCTWTNARTTSGGYSSPPSGMARHCPRMTWVARPGADQWVKPARHAPSTYGATSRLTGNSDAKNSSRCSAVAAFAADRPKTLSSITSTRPRSASLSVRACPGRAMSWSAKPSSASCSALRATGRRALRTVPNRLTATTATGTTVVAARSVDEPTPTRVPGCEKLRSHETVGKAWGRQSNPILRGPDQGKAPALGLEPRTCRLTAGRSAD